MTPRRSATGRDRLNWQVIVVIWSLVTCLGCAVFALVGYQVFRFNQPMAATTAPFTPAAAGSSGTLTTPSEIAPTATETRLFPTAPQPTIPPSAAAPVLPLPSPTLDFPTGKIIFTCTPEEYNQLCQVYPDGSGYTRLTDHQANDYYPSLWQDGASLLYVSNRTTLFEIYQRRLPGEEDQQLTDRIGNVTAPEISPDGRWIVFALKPPGGDSSIWLMGRDGSDPRRLSAFAHPPGASWSEIDPTWSPDGQWIAFAGMLGGYVELYVMDPEGGNLRQVTHGVEGIGGRSSWSPDGRQLVFYAGPRADRDLYLVDVSIGRITRLTEGGNNAGPCFSPDGQWIVFSSSRGGDHELYRIRPDGSELTQITDNGYDDWQPRWGP